MNFIYDKEAVEKAVASIVSSNIFLVGGNGGSAECASHFTAELVVSVFPFLE